MKRKHPEKAHTRSSQDTRTFGIPSVPGYLLNCLRPFQELNFSNLNSCGISVTEGSISGHPVETVFIHLHSAIPEEPTQPCGLRKQVNSLSPRPLLGDTPFIYRYWRTSSCAHSRHVSANCNTGNTATIMVCLMNNTVSRVLFLNGS